MIDSIIFGLHGAFVFLGLVIPFLRDKRLLDLYSILIPFLFYHWAVNDDTCFMTNMEVFFTDTPKERTFMGRLIGPVYNVSDDVIGKLVKSVLFSLWLFVQFRLGRLTFG